MDVGVKTASIVHILFRGVLHRCYFCWLGYLLWAHRLHFGGTTNFPLFRVFSREKSTFVGPKALASGFLKC